MAFFSHPFFSILIHIILLISIHFAFIFRMILSVGTRCRKSKFSCYQLISLVVFIPYLPMNVCLPCIWRYNDIGIDIDIDIGNIIMNSTSIQRKTARKIDQNKREIWTEKQKKGKRRRERRKKDVKFKEKEEKEEKENQAWFFRFYRMVTSGPALFSARIHTIVRAYLWLQWKVRVD